MGVGERSTLKKLVGAARRWVGADKPGSAPVAADANVSDGLRAMGVDEADIEAMLESQRSEEEQAARKFGCEVDFEVHEDCWETCLFFLAVQTQWGYAPGGMAAQRVGLNYAGVESGMRMSGKPRRAWPDLLADLQVMELAVLQADAEMAEAKGG